MSIVKPWLLPAMFVLTTQAAGAVAPDSAASAGVAAASPAAAANELQEVIVTATRREERLQDVPVSVAVFSQEKLDAQGLRGIDDLARFTPGVTFQRNALGSSGNYNDEESDINIRGIDSTAGTATVGVYIDDTPIQSRRIGFGTLTAFPALFDLERVEVLRGPQGTLFGASSEGGSVRFITPQPGLQRYSSYVRSELATTRHGDPSYEIGAAAGGPIVDDVLGFRASASYRRDGGYVDRVDYRDQRVIEPRSNWQDTATVRAALKWRATDHLNVTPSLYYQELKLNDTGAYWPSLSNPDAGIFHNGNAQSNYSIDPFYLAAIRVDWDLGAAQLVSNTSYYSRWQHSRSDYTQFLRGIYLNNPLPALGDRGSNYTEDKQNNFYEEVRLQSSAADSWLTWNVGVFYAHMNENATQFEYDNTLDQEILTATGTPFCSDAVPCPGGQIYFQPYARVIDRQLAGFGELSVRFLRQFKATVGARVSHDQFRGQSLSGGPDGAGAPRAEDNSGSETPVTPKAVLSWQPDTDTLVYASAAKGFRVGGTDTDYGLVASCHDDLIALGLRPGPDGQLHSQTTYKSDSLWSYELGGKLTLLERRLQLNGSLFSIDWKDIQQIVYLLHCGNSFTSNLGRVRSRGGDIDLQYRVTDSLTLNLTAAYTDAKYTKTVCLPGLGFADGQCTSAITGQSQGAPVVSENDRLTGAPWTFVTSAAYEFPRLAAGRPYLRVDYQYSTAQHARTPGQNPANGAADLTIPGVPIVSNLSLRAGLRWSGADVSLFAQNLTDSHPLLFLSRDSLSEVPALYFAHTQRPRTVGLTVTYRY